MPDVNETYRAFWMKRRKPPSISLRIGRCYVHTGWCPSQSRVWAMRNGETGLTIWLPPFTLDIGRDWR